VFLMHINSSSEDLFIHSSTHEFLKDHTYLNLVTFIGNVKACAVSTLDFSSDANKQVTLGHHCAFTFSFIRILICSQWSNQIILLHTALDRSTYPGFPHFSFSPPQHDFSCVVNGMPIRAYPFGCSQAPGIQKRNMNDPN
jgi:hypothetical protein